MASAYLFVDKPVSSLQCDVVTEGSATSTVGVESNKMMTANRLPDGKLRVVIYGLGQEVFSGKFAEIDDACLDVGGVVGANPDATDAHCAVVWLNSPDGVRCSPA